MIPMQSMESKPRILVVGDVLIDRYLHGAVERVNPEAPGVVFRVERTEDRPGGAGAVAMLCASLGADVVLFAPGSDETDDILEAAGVNWWQKRPPSQLTIKQRSVCNGRLMHDRIDFDHWSSATISHCLPQTSPPADAILVADYGRGAVGPDTMVVLRSLYPSVPILIDPARGADWRKYSGATVIKCNRAESADLKPIPKCRFIITDDGNGMTLDGKLIPTERRPVVDVTGAGDTVLSTLGACLARGIALEEACRYANRAAGIQVGKLGVQPIRWEDIVETVVVANGVFDCLHPGHVRLLQFAKSLGTKLIVLINSDASTRRLKGDGRPIYSQEQRKAILEALACIDEVRIFDADTPEFEIQQIRPDVLVKGEDYRDQHIAGAEFAGRIEYAPLLPGVSTTSILARLSA